MTPLASLLIGLAVAIALVAASATWLWTAQRRRLAVREGRRILAGMRWRELSNLVVEALASAGFEPEPREQAVARGNQAEVVIHRDGRPWLLACKQGLTHRITAQAAEEMVRVVRAEQAAGGVVVTPGRVAPEARLVAPNVELVDGPELWRLVEHLLPASVHEEVRARARVLTIRLTALAVLVSFVFGVLLAFLLVRTAEEVPEVFEPAPAVMRARQADVATPAATAPDATAPGAALPADAEADRRALAEKVSELPGVDRAVWSTRSTLQIFLSDAALAPDTAICAVVEGYEDLRASRLQIEAPPATDRPVRFMQCRVY